MDLIKELNKETLSNAAPQVAIGDTIKVHVKVKEGSRERVQVFEGTVIAKKHGGIEETITVRRISYGVGVEKVFPVYSPSIEKIEIVRSGKVRRAKLYYLRGRVGKGAKVSYSVLLPGAKVADGATVEYAILGENCVIGANSHIGGAPGSADYDTWGLTVLAPNSEIAADQTVRPGIMLDRSGKEVSKK